ncbi:hypothetical protein ISN44_As07g007710, partial [Arabidopsis suecica]
ELRCETDHNLFNFRRFLPTSLRNPLPLRDPHSSESKNVLSTRSFQFLRPKHESCLFLDEKSDVISSGFLLCH